MIRNTLLLGLALALPLSMVGQKPAHAAHTPVTATQAPANTQPATNTAELSNSDKLFLKALIQEDLSEIDLAHMALTKTSNPDVKQYVQTKILDADPKMRDGAAQIASARGMQVPSKPNARQDKIKDKLSKKSGKLFDNAYMNYEADQQRADVQLVNTELNSTNSADVKNYVSTQKPAVVDAAAAAKEISKNISVAMTNYRRSRSQTSADKHR